MVFAGYGITVDPFDSGEYPECPLDSAGYDDYANVDVSGKIAVVFRYGPADDFSIHASCSGGAICSGEVNCLWNFDYKVYNAFVHGASAVLFVQNYGVPPVSLRELLGKFL